MKIAKVSSVYEGYVLKRMLGIDDDEDSRNARMNAKARRLSSCRAGLRGIARAPRSRRPRTVSKTTLAVSPEIIEIQEEEVLARSPVQIVEEDPIENVKDEGEKKEKEGEDDAGFGEKVVMPTNWDVEECCWPEMKASYEEEWTMTGLENWERYDELMSGLSWFCGVDYKDEESLDWEDDLWNLRGNNANPPNP